MDRTRVLALLLSAALGGCAGTAVVPQQQSSSPSLRTNAANPHVIAEFAISAASGQNPFPYQVAAGSDGAMWFTEQAGNAIGRIDASGRITSYRIPTENAQPQGIAQGPDGTLYFAEFAGPNPYVTHLASISTAGRITQWNDSNYMPEGVARGPGGSMWFTQGCAGIAVIERGHVVQHNMQGITGESTAIVEGPDGAMWFTEDGTRAVGRMTAAGALTLYTGVLYKGSFDDVAHGVAVGPDGNLWWTSQFSNVIWAMDVRGNVVHRYVIPTRDANAWGIVAARDGALWFTESQGNKIGRVTVDGKFSEFPLPTQFAKPQGIALGRDGSLWFAESGAGKIGRIIP